MIDRLFRLLFGFPHVLRRMQYPLVLRALERLSPSGNGGIVLDVGCGDGDLIRLLPTPWYGIGVEPTHTIAAVPGRCCFVRSDGATMPFPDRFFDAIVLSSVLQMVPNEQELLSECKRVLKTGGHLILTVPSGYRFIPKIFQADFLGRALRSMLRLPETIEIFYEQLNVKHAARGRGYFQHNDLVVVLKTAGYSVLKFEYAPRALGSLIYETCLLLRWAMGLNLSVYGMGGMLLYPIGWLDRWLPPTSMGCEILVSAERAA